MWAHYAGGHGGVAIEFDFPDPKSHGIHEVDYKPRLPEILVAGPPMEELDESPTPEFVLTKKTMPWRTNANGESSKTRRIFSCLIALLLC